MWESVSLHLYFSLFWQCHSSLRVLFWLLHQHRDKRSGAINKIFNFHSSHHRNRTQTTPVWLRGPAALEVEIMFRSRWVLQWWYRYVWTAAVDILEQLVYCIIKHKTGIEMNRFDVNMHKSRQPEAWREKVSTWYTEREISSSFTFVHPPYQS